MEEIRGHDRYLDPPDGPTHWECDKCGVVFDGGDLNQIGKQDYWLCDECYGGTMGQRMTNKVYNADSRILCYNGIVEGTL